MTTNHNSVRPWLLAGTFMLATLSCATGCTRVESSEAPAAKPGGMPGVVVLPADSPKRAYLRLGSARRVPRPLLEPLSAHLLYNEAHTARVAAPISGRVVSALPEIGSPVRRGQSLVTLDSPDLASAQADAEKAAADVLLADKALERMRALFEGRVLAAKDLEQAENDAAHARAEQARAQQHLHNLQIERGRAAGQFELRAPIDGIITERSVNPGLEVRPDLTQPLFVVSDISTLWLTVDVFEKDLALLKPGLTLHVTVPAYPNERFPATIDNIGRVVDDGTRTVKVRATLANPDQRLLPAMYATVEVDGGSEDRAVVIPLTAIFVEGDHDWIYVQDAQGNFRRRQVEVGLRLKDTAVLRTGVEEGEQLVLDGALLLRSEEPAG